MRANPLDALVSFVLALSIALLPSFSAGQSKAKSAFPTAAKPTRKIEIAKVNPETAERTKLAAAKIDSLVEANYARHQITPNPPTSDEQFVRRVYLDITGTIPTYQQTVEFLEATDQDKRTKLIDRLLNSRGYASHQFNYWANILRLVDFPDNNLPAVSYVEWVKESIRDNKPYDAWVREMLTAEGKIWDNPAAGYVLRDAGMPLDSLNNTVRVFLGTQIGCAQCHDHPFDRWTQREFYQMAAFTYAVRTRGYGKGGSGAIERIRQEMLKNGGPRPTAGLQLVRANTYEVRDDLKLVLKLPHDYQYDDAQPGDVVRAAPIFPPTATLSPGQSPRGTFAAWLTSKENPRFAKAIANRLWKRALGVGLIEPVDDIRDDSVVANPKLLDYLTTVMKKLDFDLKEFQRIVHNTRTYQRQASPREPAAGEPYHFPGPVLRRMTAEQAWDSLLTLAIERPDAVLRPSNEGLAAAANMDLATVSAQQVASQWEKFNDGYGRGALQAMRREHGYKGELLARASEQPLPAPPGHFLREFGQGDREQIEAASTEGSVPQILTMFNGPVTHMMLEEGSVIYDNVIAADNISQRVDVIFLSLLSRKPTPAARNTAMKEIQAGGNVGYGDVIWSLLNTREFLFIQ
ncbi:MAG: DUF1549 domain-containing protein [Pirellulaceae bacterium]|nr:DUF1549 domain-containing protein [Pirellulaceae bacterium]